MRKMLSLLMVLIIIATIFNISYARMESSLFGYFLHYEEWGTGNKKLLTDEIGDIPYKSQSINKPSGNSASWGIMAYIIMSNGTEKEVSYGSPNATVIRTVNGGYSAQSATFTPKNTSLYTTDVLRVQWYARLDTDSWTLLFNSTTMALSGSVLNDTAWTVYYYTKYTFDGSYYPPASASLAYEGLEDSSTYYPTRIANIQIETGDITLPQFINIGETETDKSITTSVFCNITDNIGISHYLIGHNNSGTPVNGSFVPALGSSNIYVSSSFTITANVSDRVEFWFYANDTSNPCNWNNTLSYFIVTSGAVWHQIAQIYTDLKARQWTQICTIYTDLKTRLWTQIAQIYTDLKARTWTQTGTLYTDLFLSGWTQIGVIYTLLDAGYSTEETKAYFLIGVILTIFISMAIYFAYHKGDKNR